jgi:hypothetical protein
MTMNELVQAAQQMADSLNTVAELEQASRDVARPFNVKRGALRKAEMDAKRAEREAEAEKLCQALKPGEKVIMQEHGFLDIFGGSGSGDVFYNKDATVHVYQPRKKILWLNVTGTRAHKTKFEQCRPFKLHDVASYNVRRVIA